jgi:hypothetical protein
VIGLYAIVLHAPPAMAGAHGEALRAVEFDGFAALTGDAPALLSVDALRAHETAVRRIADSVDACLPARFGAAASDEAALRRALAGRETELLDALLLVKDREQMTLRVHGPGAPAPAFAPPAGPGTRYLEERRRARRLPELDPLRAGLAQMVRAERVERHSEPGLLASVYHLIDRGAAPIYARIVESTALDGMRVVVSGPWPPWSFAPEVAPT